MEIIEEFAQYIEDNTDFEVGKEIFIGKQPDRDKRVDCITCYQREGLQSTGEISDIMDIVIQVIVRNRKYATGSSIAQEIRNLLHGKNRYTLVNDGTFILYSQAMSDVAQHIGADENGNDEFSINFHLKLR